MCLFCLSLVGIVTSVALDDLKGFSCRAWRGASCWIRILPKIRLIIYSLPRCFDFTVKLSPSAQPRVTPAGDSPIDRYLRSTNATVPFFADIF